MKNIVRLIGFAFLAFFVVACSKNALSDGAKSIDSSVLKNLNLEGAPNWVLNGGDGDMSAIGSANIIDSNLQFARTEAMANARDELARQISVEVKGSFESTNSKSGKQIIQMSEQKIMQILSQTLSGTKQTDIWITKDSSTLFVLIKLSPELISQFKTNIKQEVMSANLQDSKAINEAIDKAL